MSILALSHGFTSMTTIGLISPGAMGASVGAAALSDGKNVVWASEGRSADTHQRAESAGLRDCGTLDDLVASADIILSVCPPHDAEPVAKSVADRNFSGVFVDCNAISPMKTVKLSEQFDRFVDGGIVGGPAWRSEAGTCLYLSGIEANEIAQLFTGSPLHTQVISDDIGAASAMKMTFAAYTKGSTALLVAILGVAERYGVRETLEQQWGESFTTQTHQRVLGSSHKAWRFSGEMLEIAETFAGAELPGGFHQAAAEVFERLAVFKEGNADSVEQLLVELNKRS
ncbi:MAG: NAD(P)-dependent oxidoreductase [Pseudomonadales bacterium]|nr:NAD(P)-dependent oxidoreductase [Pseudomonadales bacterium]MBO6597799.1 NAD(P)-dependent oxidoreductase [Pseudomonadales bacterium]MBO6824037.1 NAD(P)-dependent oxidoreductase [Pseudomonadales bacterium]